MLARASTLLPPIGFVCAILLASIATPAQCEPVFAPGTGNMGFYLSATAAAHVEATCVWDPDGPGPATPLLAFGGNFRFAGNVEAHKLATFDPVTGTWASIGGGIPDPGAITSLVPLPNGDLVVGGSFTTIQGVPLRGIARWTGFSWERYGSGITGGVEDIVRLPNGDLVASTGVPSLVRWSGSGWGSMGITGDVGAMTVLPNGDLVVAGSISAAGGVPVSVIARWDGAVWSAFPPGPFLTSEQAYALAVMPNGDIVLSHWYRIYRFDGATWTRLDTATTPGGVVSSLLALPNGDLLTGNAGFVHSSLPLEGVHRWDGVSWTLLGSGFSANVRSLTLSPSGDVLAAGWFQHADGRRVDGAAIWDGTNWSPLSAGTEGAVYTIAASHDRIVVGGGFATFAGVSCSNVVLQENGAWSAPGGGVDGIVRAAALLPGGDIVVAGDFQLASGVLARRVARWNGSLWQPLSSGCNSGVNAIAVMPGGDVVVTGDFTTAGGVAASRIARWNGANWAPLGSGLEYRGTALRVLANGDLIVGGQFTIAGGTPARNIARWDGAAWSALGNGLDIIPYAILQRPSGELVVGGERTIGYVDRIWIWNGVAWTGLDSAANGGPVTSLATLPGGDLLAAGGITTIGTTTVANIARRTGSAWTPVAGGFDGLPRVMTSASDGTVLIGGDFTIAGTTPSSRFARLTSTCPASSSRFGSGCAGTAGTPGIEQTAFAWLGEASSFVGTNIPANALAIAVGGTSQVSVPLAALHPAGVAGCQLLASLDVTLVLVPASGSVTWNVPIPVDPTLIGASFYSQVVPAGFGATGLESLTSSEGIVSTIGVF